MTLLTHPGLRILKTIREHGLGSVSAAAQKLGMRREELNRVINGTRGISPELAAGLEAVFGDSAATWLRLQTDYDHAMLLRFDDNRGMRRGL